MSLSEKIAAVVAAIGAELKLKADASDLATVATSGNYGDLSGLPTLGTAAAQNTTAFATAAQGTKADSAVQPGDLAGIESELDTKLDEAAVDARVGVGTAALVDQAPATLDTLNELAAALGDDPNFATTVANQIGTKADAAATQAALNDKAPTVHTHTASQISDSTTVGRSLVTAASQAAARTAIGAGTSSLTIGTTASTACAGNDARLSDARTPEAGSVTNSSVAANAAIALSKLATGNVAGSKSGTPADLTVWVGPQASVPSSRDANTVYLWY
ncbi:hypothetical protein PP713_08710 [Mycobacterium sp. CSUR Q5927]|nr:hypothetical protein [Mycobacterium sp. CSUR Q5927]